jgi:hypothetical protein
MVKKRRKFLFFVGKAIDVQRPLQLTASQVDELRI